MEIRNTTPLHVLIALCCISITVLCMTGRWFPGFYLATFIITAYMLIGARKHGKLDLLFFCFPICTFFVVWIIGFTLAQKYAVMFYDRTPDFTIFGFNPSFFWIFTLYWLAPVFILTIGFTKLRDRWMSQAEWDAFKAQMVELRKQEAQANGQGA